MPVIRPLTPHDDFDAVGDVYAQSWRASYQGLLPQHFLDKLTHDRWSAMLRAEPSASLGLFEHDRIIGAAMVSFSREPGREGYGEIVSLYLLPGLQGRGHGKRLLNAALRRLADEGCENFCLWVLSQNARAIGFYRHMGFRESGRTLVESYGGEPAELCELVRGEG